MNEEEKLDLLTEFIEEADITIFLKEWLFDQGLELETLDLDLRHVG